MKFSLFLVSFCLVLMNLLGSATLDSRKSNSCKNVTDIRCDVKKNAATSSTKSPIHCTNVTTTTVTTTSTVSLSPSTNVTTTTVTTTRTVFLSPSTTTTVINTTTTGAQNSVITVTAASVNGMSVSTAPYEATTGLEVTPAINTVATPSDGNLYIYF